MSNELDLPHEITVAFLSSPLWRLTVSHIQNFTFLTISFAFVILTPLKYGEVDTFAIGHCFTLLK